MISPEQGVTEQVRKEVLKRDGYVCRMCGAKNGDPDEYNPRSQVRLHVRHIIDWNRGGTDELANLRVLCNTCSEGTRNLVQEPPSWIWLLGQLRRANHDDQLKALEWLEMKFRTGKNT